MTDTYGQCSNEEFTEMAGRGTNMKQGAVGTPYMYPPISGSNPNLGHAPRGGGGMPQAPPMSMLAQQSNQPQMRPAIIVTDNDVLCGRGVNIAHHPGNERFRTLVTARQDESYCTSYSASEKRAVAEEIVRHISSLNPSGRFLRREGRGQVSRGLNGPWEALTEREAIKKTCQALRDCNRLDRQGYAVGIVPPEDVVSSMKQRQATGMTGKQQAAAAAAASAAAAAAAATATLKRTREQIAANLAVMPPPMVGSASYTASNPGMTLSQPPHSASSATNTRPLSPSVESAAEWLKKQRTDPSNDPSLFSTNLSHDSILASFGTTHHDPASFQQASHPMGQAPAPATEEWHTQPNQGVVHAAPQPANATQQQQQQHVSPPVPTTDEWHSLENTHDWQHTAPGQGSANQAPTAAPPQPSPTTVHIPHPTPVAQLANAAHTMASHPGMEAMKSVTGMQATIPLPNEMPSPTRVHQDVNIPIPVHQSLEHQHQSANAAIAGNELNMAQLHGDGGNDLNVSNLHHDHHQQDNRVEINVSNLHHHQDINGELNASNLHHHQDNSGELNVPSVHQPGNEFNMSNLHPSQEGDICGNSNAGLNASSLHHHSGGNEFHMSSLHPHPENTGHVGDNNGGQGVSGNELNMSNLHNPADNAHDGNNDGEINVTTLNHPGDGGMINHPSNQGVPGNELNMSNLHNSAENAHGNELNMSNMTNGGGLNVDHSAPLGPPDALNMAEL